MLPLKLYCPSNYSPFFTGMAKETRMYRTLNLTLAPASSSCHQSETKGQWSGLQGRWIWDVEWLIWEASITCNSSTLPIIWSRQSSALACAWEEGCVMSSETEVKCSISSSVSPPYSAASSLGIWKTPIDDPRIWTLLRIMVYTLIGSFLCITWSPLSIFTFALKIRDMTRLKNGRVSLEFLFVMLLVKMW